MVLSVVPTAAQTEVPKRADGPAIAAADIVHGVLTYTQWPSQDGPLRLCLAGQSRLMAGLDNDVLPSGRRMIVSRGAPASLLGEGCHAIYVGIATGNELVRIVRSASGSAVGTSTDSDAVSRSTVRIDPRVMVLATRGRRR